MERALVKDLYAVENVRELPELKEPRDLVKRIENYGPAKTFVRRGNKTGVWKSNTKRAAYAMSSVTGAGSGYVVGTTYTLVMELGKMIYNLPHDILQLNLLESFPRVIYNLMDIFPKVNYNGGIAAAVGLVAGPIVLKCLKSSTFSFFGWIYNGVASIFKR